MKKSVIIILSALIISAWIDPLKDEVEKGNNSLKSGKSAEALEHYREAEKHAPDEKTKAVIDFNRGTAHYQMGEYDTASDKFKSSISSEDPGIQKKALFNMGNSYFKQKKYKEAADSYIKALQIDPNYEKAKKNLEYLLKKQDDKNSKNDKNSDGQSGDSSRKEKNTGKDSNPADNEKNMKSIQAKNLLESMKNKPVRKQKGKGDGTKYLEKYW